MSSEYTQQRVPIYPRSVKGRYRFIKTMILVLAYGVYFSLPWLGWHRLEGPDQAVLFDISGRKFYLFDLVVYAQDIFWLAGFLIIAAFLLFFVTGIAGRVFCGYFCFQTLWTDVFMFIERHVQGERNKRMKLASSPWDANKILRMGTTWFLWLLVAFLTGFSFTLYWGDSSELFTAFFTGKAPFPAYATTLFLTLTTFVMAGLAREQVCTYMCPYARFQGAMFDQDTLIIAYDEKRGEGKCGRCKPTKQASTLEERQQLGYGDCIDCGYCVQVCPMGIDIRNGMQYQCISCALCVDACNTIMDTIGAPRGLVRYSSEKQMQGGKTRWIKGKSIGYAVLLLAATALLVSSILNRAPLELRVYQVRQPLYVVLHDGRVQNHYEIKLNNKLETTEKYTLRIEGLKNAEWFAKPSDKITLPPAHSQSLDVFIRKQPGKKTKTPFTFIVENESQGGKTRVRAESVFIQPAAQ
jgi:cytochrome c oxidase accessory protein FixG